MAVSVALQLPLPFWAASATAAKSRCSGPALPAGIRPAPEPAQEIGNAAAAPSAAVASARADTGHARLLLADRALGMVIDRTPGARRASRAGAQRGSPRR